MVLTGAKAALWCPECSSVQMCKVLSMAPGYTRITWAECCVCAVEFDPWVLRGPDQGEEHDRAVQRDLDHTPGENTESDGLPSAT